MSLKAGALVVGKLFAYLCFQLLLCFVQVGLSCHLQYFLLGDSDHKFFTHSLVVLGNNTEFERAIIWLSENLTFDIDVRINLFEVLSHLIEKLLAKSCTIIY